MEKRINPTTGRTEYKIAPQGLPEIWVSLFCDRCKEFDQCLRFDKLSDEEWKGINHTITETNSLTSLSQSYQDRGFESNCNSQSEEYIEY